MSKLELVLVKLPSVDLSNTEGYLKNYIAKLEGILSKVPEEFRDSVEISYDTYQEAYDHIYRTDADFCYWREETEEEASAREESDKFKSDKSRSEKMKQYEELKKELGL